MDRIPPHTMTADQIRQYLAWLAANRPRPIAPAMPPVLQAWVPWK